MNLDVVVVGGGPAGLSASLILGRARKHVLLTDAGTPRNASAEHVHNFPTRDGVSPKELRAIARSEIGAYPTVSFREQLVTDVAREGARLRVTFADHTNVLARRVLLAGGLVDVPPDVPGMRELWGRSVFVCPYCHGYEARDRRWGVLAPSDAIAEWAFLLLGWTSQLTVFTNGAELSPELVARFDRAAVPVETGVIERLVTHGDHLGAVGLLGERHVPCEALFVRPVQTPTPLITKLGLDLEPGGFVRVAQPSGESSMPGVHVAGDASTMMQSALGAASSGMNVAAVMNHALTVEGYP